MLKDLYEWTIHWAGTPYSVWALFFIAVAESSFFPFPPDLLLIPMCLGNPEYAFVYAGVCLVGSVLGGVIGLGIGRYGGRPVLVKLFSQDKIDVAEAMYQKYDVWALAISGFTPIPYKVFSITSGVFRVRLGTFILVSAIARGLRFFLIAWLIYAFGEPIQAFIDKYFNLLSVIFVVCLVGGFFALKLFSKKPSEQT